MKPLAQGIPLGNINGIGPLGTGASSAVNAFTLFTATISTAIGVVTISAGLFFMAQVFSGSFLWLTSGGDKQALENAKKRLTHAIIGLLLIVLSYALISIIGLIFGINILSPYKSLLGIGGPGDPGGPLPPCIPGQPC